MKNLPMVGQSERLANAAKLASERTTTRRLLFESITIFVNRACPRTCFHCGIADNSLRSMSTENWIQAFDNLNRVFGAKFYLFLGTEPLILGQGLIDMIRWFKSKGLFYGFYSTSPEPLFSRWKEKLIEAGIDNWSAGIDMLPHLGETDPNTAKKVRESIVGLQWMADRGIQTHTQITVSRLNLDVIPQIMEWCWDNIKGVQCNLNFVEWRKSPEFDFFSPPEDMKSMLWDGTPEERAHVRKVMGDVLALSRVEGRIMQTPDEYLMTAHQHYDKLDVHCQGVVGPSVDADGSLRVCGYNRGVQTTKWSALDLTPENYERFLDDWEKEMWSCSGCHWAWVPMLQEDPRILDPISGFHQSRWILNPTKLK